MQGNPHPGVRYTAAHMATDVTRGDLAPDLWSDWLHHRRHGGDPAYEAIVRRMVQDYADRVLDEAGLFPGMVLADVGAGDGLVAFRAIERLGGAVRVVLTDISASLLARARAAAATRQVEGSCTFLECSGEHLAAIGDATLDAVTARSSIAYMADKKAAFAEFHRVLKPGGKLSIAEPILQDEAFAARALRQRVLTPSGTSADRFMELLHRCKAAQFPDTEQALADSPLVNFSERDLLGFAGRAGFADLHLRLHIDVTGPLSTSWNTFLETSPHPWAPPLSVILEGRFTPDERQLFESVMRPVVESGANQNIDRIAFLHATKPRGKS